MARRDNTMKTLILAVAFLAWGAPGEPLAREEAKALVPVELEITLSQAQGSPVTYRLYLLADSDRVTRLRSGREVAVPVTSLSSPGGEPAAAPPVATTSFQYRNVGMNVTGSARSEGDRFRVRLELERSAMYEGAESGPPGERHHPSFQTFSIGNELLLGDGEKASLVTGSDPFVGNLWRVEVTLRARR
jgi:hypothetical protein